MQDMSGRSDFADMVKEGLFVQPDKQAITWKNILNLPFLKNAYLSLVKERKLGSLGQLRVKQNIRIDFASQLDFACLLIDRLQEIFKDKELFIYEVALTILVNWCREWILLSPNPPFPTLAFCSTLLRHHLPDVFTHIAALSVQNPAWPMLSSFFTKIVETSKWGELMDHIISNHPSFILFLPLAFFRINRNKILQIKDKSTLQEFVESPPTCIDPANLTRLAYNYYENTPAEIHPKQYIADFSPLTPTLDGCYPAAPQSAFAVASMVKAMTNSVVTQSLATEKLDSHFEGIDLGEALDWQISESVLDAGFSVRMQIVDLQRSITY